LPQAAVFALRQHPCPTSTPMKDPSAAAESPNECS
jgi:hypothetical protein